MLTRLQRWNLAVDEIRGGTILSENDNSIEAKACRRHYPQVIAEMLVGKEFSIAKQRQALTEITNDREAEWVYAYTLPANVGTIARLLPDFEQSGLGIPVPSNTSPYYETWIANGAYDAQFIIEGQTIYTNAAGATVEFTINDLDGLNVGPLIDKAITLELAARLAVPVKADRDLKRELMAQARVAWDEAVADDRNRHPNSYGDGYVSEMEMARAGYIA